MQLKPFDPSKGGTTAGYCLRNVRLGYDIPALYNDAWTAWLNTQQHRNRNFPAGDIPLFYDYTDSRGNRYGHINVRYRDGRVWNDGRWFSSLSAFESAWGNVKFVGWGESINNVRVLGGNQLMDTDAKVANQYHTLRGNSGTAAERKGWVGRSYEEFNATARAEVAAREAHRLNLENAVKSLTTERDQARAQVATLTKEVLGLRDQLKVEQAKVQEKDAELSGLQESIKQLEEQKKAQISELTRAIEIKDREIVRLTKELESCGGEQLSWSQHLVLGIRGLLNAINPLSK
jgi:hypothetical protein